MRIDLVIQAGAVIGNTILKKNRAKCNFAY
jgi:hypothetical protein